MGAVVHSSELVKKDIVIVPTIVMWCLLQQVFRSTLCPTSMELTEIWVRWDYNALSSFRGNGSVEFNFRLKFIKLETLFLELEATVLLNWLQQPTTQFCLQLQLWSAKSNFSYSSVSSPILRLCWSWWTWNRRWSQDTDYWECTPGIS